MKTIILAIIMFFSLGRKNGDPPLHLAVKNNNLSRVESLLKRGANPNQKDNLGFTPLHIGAYFGHKDITMLLIHSGAMLNVETTNGNTPAQLAIQQGHIELVKEFYNKGWDINYLNQSHSTAIHTAAEYSQYDLVSFLIEKGAEVNARSKYSRTPLHCAFYNDNDSIANLLIQKGAQPNMIGKNASDLYATAKVFEMFANLSFHNGDIKNAIIHRRIATDYLEKASIQFSKVSKNFTREASNRKWSNILEFVGAAASAYGSAISSPLGYGTGYHRVRETTTFEEMAEIYKEKSENCHASAIKSYLFLNCIDSVSLQTELDMCSEQLKNIIKEPLTDSITEVDFKKFLNINFQEYVKSEAYQNYIKDIMERSANKDITRFVIPTYEAMISGVYKDLEDSNVAMTARTSPEMFVQAFLNFRNFMKLFERISRIRQMDNDEFFVACKNDCLLSNKRFYLVDKNQLSMAVNLQDIRVVQQDIKFTKVKTTFELKSGEILVTNKTILKPAYIDRFRELLNQ